MNPTIHQRFADVIKAIRQRESLTQRALAKMLEVSPGYVGQWECGLSKPSAEIIDKICQLFGIENSAYLHQLAYAETAPAYIKQSMFFFGESSSDDAQGPLSACEARIISLVRQLPAEQHQLVIQKLEAWVRACTTC